MKKSFLNTCPIFGEHHNSYEGEIPAEYFPVSFDVHSGKKYKREIIQYCIPCAGDVRLLNYSPASMITLGGGGNFEIDGNTLVTEVINFYNNPEEIKGKYDSEVGGIHSNYYTLKNDIENFNSSLNDQILVTLRQRKQKILSKNNLLSQLGVPLKKNDGVASTFAIPNPQHRGLSLNIP